MHYGLQPSGFIHPDLRNIKLYTRSFKVYGIWPQASKHTHTCAMQSRQCGARSGSPQLATKFAYYASIFPDARVNLLCSKLIQHNVDSPSGPCCISALAQFSHVDRLVGLVLLSSQSGDETTETAPTPLRYICGSPGQKSTVADFDRITAFEALNRSYGWGSYALCKLKNT